MKVTDGGSRINPARKDWGFSLPDVIDSLTEMTNGQKILYRYLVRRAGENGYCYPSQKRVATDLGMSERQVRYLIKALKEAGLIGVRKSAARRTNEYIFFAVPAFSERQRFPGRETQQGPEFLNTREDPDPGGSQKDQLLKLGQSLFEYVQTDHNGNRLYSPKIWAQSPPDMSLLKGLAKACGYDFPEMTYALQRLKRSGSQPELSYGWFLKTVPIEVAKARASRLGARPRERR